MGDEHLTAPHDPEVSSHLELTVGVHCAGAQGGLEEEVIISSPGIWVGHGIGHECCRLGRVVSGVEGKGVEPPPTRCPVT